MRMKDFILNMFKTLWLNHRKKLIAFLMGLLFAGLAAISGIPLSEIQDAAKEAANKPVTVVEPAPAVPAPIPVPVNVAPKDLPPPAAPKK
jgi:hypothetical protein